jgi:predicted ArsR family transcriptional regulator
MIPIEYLGVMIPIIGVSIPIVAIWTKHRKDVMQMQIEATSSQTAEKAAQYASRVQELEDRVRVLERIVTDSGYNVATQIDALRDQRQVEDKNSGVALDIDKQPAR